MKGFIPAQTCEYPIEYLPAEAITPQIGLCLALDGTNSGQLEASVTPQFICLTERAAAVSAGELIPVVRVKPDMVFAATLDGSTSLKAGAIAAVKSDGMQIDADGTTSRCFLIEKLMGSSSGDLVYGRFVDKIADPAVGG